MCVCVVECYVIYIYIHVYIYILLFVTYIAYYVYLCGTNVLLFGNPRKANKTASWQLLLLGRFYVEMWQTTAAEGLHDSH